MNPSDLARYVGAAPTWLAEHKVSGGNQNPANATVVCDTLALGAGYYDVSVLVFSNCPLGAANLYCQWRNAANSDSVLSIPVYAQYGWGVFFELRGIKITLNERFRLYVGTGFTGLVGGSIVAVRRI